MIKTRQQLQGELMNKEALKGQKMPYTNIRQAIRNIVKYEGLWGLQKGLTSALAFQAIMNSIRLGISYFFHEGSSKSDIISERPQNMFGRLKKREKNSLIYALSKAQHNLWTLL